MGIGIGTDTPGKLRTVGRARMMTGVLQMCLATPCRKRPNPATARLLASF
ncbi:MAG: hypothetical protein LBR89_03265 [Holosporales bacterium]|nr:hypothetical protein [Holosporales bacterium]